MSTLADEIPAEQVLPDRAELAARDLLDALGVDLTAEGLEATPRRMAAAMRELMTPRPFVFTTFPNDEGYSEPVIVSGIRFVSLCEHHMLPFYGEATVGYVPGARVLGLSKLARAVEHVSRRPQTQERLTLAIVRSLVDAVRPRAVAAVVRAEHTCMTLRGAQAPGTQTETSSAHGDNQRLFDRVMRAADRSVV